MFTPEGWLAAAWGDFHDNIIYGKQIQTSLLVKREYIQVAFLNLPTTDLFSAPSQERLQEGVAWMVDEASSGKGSVYVHCKAGRARSATLVAAYLMQVQHQTVLPTLSYLSLTISR